MKGILGEGLYVAACVLVPGLWGAFTAWLFTRRDQQKRITDQERPQVDYMI